MQMIHQAEHYLEVTLRKQMERIGTEKSSQATSEYAAFLL
jgi:hypothetical protein